MSSHLKCSKADYCPPRSALIYSRGRSLGFFVDFISEGCFFFFLNLSRAPQPRYDRVGVSYACPRLHSFGSSHSPALPFPEPRTAVISGSPSVLSEPCFPYLPPPSHLGMIVCNCSFWKWLSVRPAKGGQVLKGYPDSAAWKLLFHSTTVRGPTSLKTTKGWWIPCPSSSYWENLFPVI